MVQVDVDVAGGEVTVVHSEALTAVGSQASWLLPHQSKILDSFPHSVGSRDQPDQIAPKSCQLLILQFLLLRVGTPAK